MSKDVGVELELEIDPNPWDLETIQKTTITTTTEMER